MNINLLQKNKYITEKMFLITTRSLVLTEIN